MTCFGEADGSKERDKQRKMVEDLIGLVEFAFIGSPFSETMGFLVENARSSVLYSSLSKVKYSTGLPTLLARIWMADVDVAKGRAGLLQEIQNLPKAVFLRVIMCVHIIHRVYWHHSRKEDRNGLLDAAEEAFKSLNITINREDIKRRLEEIDVTLSPRDRVG